MDPQGDWSRDRWVGFADSLLSSAMEYASDGHGRIRLPGAEGGYGRAVDGLEGFARTFLLAGFRIAGERGVGVDHLIDFYSRGIATGVDPDAADRWVRLEEHAQAKVEAASIALVLDLTRPWIWDRLDALTQQRVIAYLEPVVGDDTYPQTNWVWFRIVVQTFLRSVGGAWSAEDIAADLARHDSFVREDGWMADGVERAFDHYVGWALHVYPVLWSRMQGAAELAAGRRAHDTAQLDRYLSDALALTGGDGSPLLQGRSLIYRFAAAAPFWVGVLAEVPLHSPGALRRAASAVVSHFADHGAPDERGVLTMGWHHEWRTLAQSYSGPGSPYWAVKGMLGIALPADHPVWSAPAEPLPIERSDELLSIASPGWIVSGTRDDGIVRVVNHGTDKALVGTVSADSPLYARLGYSTAAAPLLDERGWSEPLEQSVALVDATGAGTARTGMTCTGTAIDGSVGRAGSSWDAHWIRAAASSHRHGEGLSGSARLAGHLVVDSLVRGPWELRVVRVESLADDVRPEDLRLRIGGWATAGDDVATAADDSGASAASAGRTSAVALLSGGAVDPDVVERDGASPLGPRVAVPVLSVPVVVGEPVVALITLTGADAPLAAAVRVAREGDDLHVSATWPDGLVTEHVLTDSGGAARPLRYPRTRGGVLHADAKEQHA
ncbi:hypothetical protein ASF48_08060 [Rathayibacter sp. Leaf299]|uniref:DUF2264 domain-containing protein n=1 Tax=Rathayibacter sp. Leaf299 TaxID=1736328 RepID=UPI0006FF0403|nr:DUF2264 domain-containing protein [Rathayibacter sp. Leaf299]KQQ20573.1 hypothetical protein ASF48_08060 [Rathayibacter sp. Leaf299]